MPPVPSLTQAFSALGKALIPPAPTAKAVPASAPAARPATPNLFSSIGSFFSDAYNKGQQMLSQPRPSAPVVGVSSPAALSAAGLGKTYQSLTPQTPAVPKLPAPTATYSSLAPVEKAYSSMASPSVQYSSMASPDKQYGSLTSPGTQYGSLSQTKAPAAPTAPAVPTTTTATQPRAPQTFAEPIVAPSGTRVDPNTGGVVSGAPALPQAPDAPLAIANTGNAAGAADYSAAAGGAPGSGAPGTPAVPSLEDEYLKSLKATKEEEDAQARLDELAGAAALSDANIQNLPIALPFITGQQAAVERSRAARAVPIAAQLARLQAKRQMSLDFSKAALEREDKKTEAGKPVVVGEKSSLVDPRTGKVVFGGAPAGAEAPQTGSWSSLIKSGQASLSDVPADMRSAVAEELAASPEVSKKGKDAIGQATVVMDYIDQADGQINGFTTGVVGIGSAMIPGTPAYNLARTIDTIKANVGFQALQAMRDASPTGGALGQVSEQENRLLQATLGSLDIGQGEAQLRANMAKVRQHFSNLVAILSAGPGATATTDASGNVVMTGGKGGATTDVASEGWF